MHLFPVHCTFTVYIYSVQFKRGFCTGTCLMGPFSSADAVTLNIFGSCWLEEHAGSDIAGYTTIYSTATERKQEEICPKSKTKW